MSSDEPVAPDVIDRQALVQIEGLCVGFDDGEALFRSADLDIAEGEMVAIVGRNGSGKSTLLRCVAGLQSFDGEMRFHAQSEARPRLRVWGERLARLVLGAPLALLFAAVTALFVSNVAYNFFDWLRNEGSCDPSNPIVVSCEEGFRRDATAWLGEGLTHDITRGAYAPFYYERVDWGVLVSVAWWLGVALALATLVVLALWWTCQSTEVRGRAIARTSSRLLDLGVFGGLVLLVVSALQSGVAWWTLAFFGALVPLALAEGARPRRLRIAYIPQRLGLVERSTVLENVLHGLLVNRQGLGRLRGLFGIWTGADVERATACLEVVATPELAERRVESLSGGERRRIAMARALVQRAELLLADEFLSEVDAATAERLIDHLRALCRESGTAVIFVEHDLELAVRTSDRAYALTPTGLETFAGGALD